MYKKDTNLTYRQKIGTGFVTCYPEQYLDDSKRQALEMARASKNLANKEKTIKHYIKLAYERFKTRIEEADKKYFIVGIMHDKDVMQDPKDFTKTKPKKTHFHILFFVITGKDKRFRVSEMLKILGIRFSKDKDKSLFNNGGVQRSQANRRPNLACYQTHETLDAMNEGKHKYEVSELVTNQPIEAVKALRSKYVAVKKHKKLSSEDWEQLALEAHDLGYNVGDFEAWSHTHFTIVQEASSTYRVVRKYYFEGLDKRISEDPAMVRCSILIWGDPGLGKTFTTNVVLNKLGENVYAATGGTGKYDGLTASKTAMTFDDVPTKDSLNVFDNKICKLYRRGEGDRPWRGRYAIATANDDPFTWISQMRHLPYTDEYALEADGVTYKDKSNRNKFEALLSRLYICHIEDGHLVLDSIETRGNKADDEAHDKLFVRFASEFNRQLANHFIETGEVDARLFDNSPEFHDKTSNNCSNASKVAKKIVDRLGKNYLSKELQQAYLDYKTWHKNHDEYLDSISDDLPF